jgi:hypothetical protein
VADSHAHQMYFLKYIFQHKLGVLFRARKDHAVYRVMARHVRITFAGKTLADSIYTFLEMNNIPTE